MTLTEAQKLIAQGEGQQIEFKLKAKHPDRIVREIVAFSNSKGGHLFIGVDDDGSIIGLKDAEEAHYVMEKAVKELCRPQIEYEYQIIPIIDGKSAIVHYQFESGKKKPYFAFLKPFHKRGRSFVRLEDRSIQASRELRQILKFSLQDNMTPFEYGENEKMLLNYLGNHEEITVNTFSAFGNIDKQLASQTLIKLTVNNVLKVIPDEKEDRFIFVA
ncbi:MAG: ATP-binding protein [Flammeovirgaceae bacterium]|jgi:predicted HTH transcriptional regulator|nr:ATP-binding protein [Flammeovirgaceae bacterium]